MAKHLHYSCDNSCCKNTTQHKNENWLSISSSNNSLQIENHLPNRRLYSVANYGRLDFCSRNCFVTYFFDEKPLAPEN